MIKEITSITKLKMCDNIIDTIHASNNIKLKSKHYAVVLPHGKDNGWYEKGIFWN